MNRYRLSRRATSDLRNIWDDVAKDRPAAADAHIDALPVLEIAYQSITK
jgi:plasmid stabilization system protein ParE